MSAYGCFADVYDTLTSNIDYKELAGYYDRIITSHGGKRGILLDLACGTGSMSMQFSALGYDVIGVDLSTEMLSVAKEKPHKNIEYLCQDMCELDMYGTIDVTVCVLDSINHLDSKENILRCFSSVSLFCDPEGLFVFDINTVKSTERCLRITRLCMIWKASIAYGRIILTVTVKTAGSILHLIFSLKTRTALMSVPVRIFQRLLYRLKKLKNYCIRQASEFLTDIII